MSVNNQFNQLSQQTQPITVRNFTTTLTEGLTDGSNTYQRPDTNSELWLYVYPSNYHTLIDSDNLEFWEHYSRIINSNDNDMIKQSNINYLRNMNRKLVYF